MGSTTTLRLVGPENKSQAGGTRMLRHELVIQNFWAKIPKHRILAHGASAKFLVVWFNNFWAFVVKFRVVFGLGIVFGLF